MVLFVALILIVPIQAEPKLWGPVNVPMTVDTAWYVQPQIRYANYVTNPALLAANKISPQQASQYLYDRPRALIQLYLLTGDEKWRTHAIDASQFYINHIGSDGYFTLIKKKDVKYLMPKGLQLYFQLTGDETAKNAITRRWIGRQTTAIKVFGLSVIRLQHLMLPLPYMSWITMSTQDSVLNRYWLRQRTWLTGHVIVGQAGAVRNIPFHRMRAGQTALLFVHPGCWPCWQIQSGVINS
jgi:hypothetical protein